MVWYDKYWYRDGERHRMLLHPHLSNRLHSFLAGKHLARMWANELYDLYTNALLCDSLINWGR